jgi:RNA polymerase sigma-70 factor (ECF subfamily)
VDAGDHGLTGVDGTAPVALAGAAVPAGLGLGGLLGGLARPALASLIILCGAGIVGIAALLGSRNMTRTGFGERIATERCPYGNICAACPVSQAYLELPAMVGTPGVGREAELPGRADFEAATLPHLKSLFRLALRLTGEPSSAEDLVQETYLRALQSFGTLRDPACVRPWLFQILNRLVIDRHRTRDRERPTDFEALDRFSLYDLISDEDPFPYSDRLHDDFLARFRDEEVRNALRALPEAFQLPLVLLYTEEMSYRELAEVLGCPIGTVMSRIHRGRKMLERGLWELAERRGLVKTWQR